MTRFSSLTVERWTWRFGLGVLECPPAETNGTRREPKASKASEAYTAYQKSKACLTLCKETSRVRALFSALRLSFSMATPCTALDFTSPLPTPSVGLLRSRSVVQSERWGDVAWLAPSRHSEAAAPSRGPLHKGALPQINTIGMIRMI